MYVFSGLILYLVIRMGNFVRDGLHELPIKLDISENLLCAAALISALIGVGLLAQGLSGLRGCNNHTTGRAKRHLSRARKCLIFFAVLYLVKFVVDVEIASGVGKSLESQLDSLAFLAEEHNEVYNQPHITILYDNGTTLFANPGTKCLRNVSTHAKYVEPSQGSKIKLQNWTHVQVNVSQRNSTPLSRRSANQSAIHVQPRSSMVQSEPIRTRKNNSGILIQKHYPKRQGQNQIVLEPPMKNLQRERLRPRVIPTVKRNNSRPAVLNVTHHKNSSTEVHILPYFPSNSTKNQSRIYVNPSRVNSSQSVVVRSLNKTVANSSRNASAAGIESEPKRRGLHQRKVGMKARSQNTWGSSSWKRQSELRYNDPVYYCEAEETVVVQIDKVRGHVNKILIGIYIAATVFNVVLLLVVCGCIMCCNRKYKIACERTICLSMFFRS